MAGGLRKEGGHCELAQKKQELIGTKASETAAGVRLVKLGFIEILSQRW